MESIRILQDTYEKLYLLTEPIYNLMEKEFPKIKNWKTKCDKILNAHTNGKIKEWSYFFELDLYYLLVLLEAEWQEVSELSNSDFFSEKNKKLFVSKWEFSIQSIRNDVAHPENWDYQEDTYQSWTNSLNDAACALGENLKELRLSVHKSEKEKLFNFIAERTFEITMNSPHFKELPQSKQESIARTKKRLKDQTTAAGIMALFEDSYFLKKGQPIKEGLEEYKLPTFEDVMDEVRDFYYFGKWSPIKRP